MYHCYKRKRGVFDRQYVTQSVLFRKEMKYERVLQKCISVTFPDDNVESNDNYEYYIANGKGMSIYSGDTIQIENENGEEESIPWTLETYIQLSNARYASKTRLYCVKKFFIEGKKQG